jgi:hypothetical protein
VGFRYDEDFGFLSDVDLWLRMAMHWDVGQVERTLLTCRRRGSDHPFSGNDWRLIGWTAAIHRKNLQRLMSLNQRKWTPAARRLPWKIRLLFVRSLAAAAASGDRNAVRDGFVFLRGDIDPLARALAVAGQRGLATSALMNGFCSAAMKAAGVRKRIAQRRVSHET